MRTAAPPAPLTAATLSHLVLAIGVLSLTSALSFAVARADDAPIATASPDKGQAQAPATTASPVQTISPNGVRDDQTAPDGVDDRKVHGQVAVEVGTNGWRRTSAVIAAPIGQTGGVVIAVDRAEGRSRLW